jgi:hypothetical protein
MNCILPVTITALAAVANGDPAAQGKQPALSSEDARPTRYYRYLMSLTTP